MYADEGEMIGTCSPAAGRVTQPSRLLSAAIGVASAAIGVIALGSTASAAPISMKDDAGRTVEIAAPAKRIVALAPFLTELAFSADAGDRVVGVSEHSDYPEAARRLPQVASSAGISIESLMALQPDLVLAWQDTIRQVDLARLDALHIPVFVAQARSITDVPRLFGVVARFADTKPEAALRGFDTKIAAAAHGAVDRPRIAAFLEIWHQPLTTIAGRHWMNEALDLCGATNVFKDLEGVAPVVAWESLYARDPEVVVGMGSARDAAAFRAQWRDRATLSAVKNDRLVFVDADLIQRPTLRLADGVVQLCDGLRRSR
jgi:iron complex transport system substrate-binding protein